VFKSRMLRETFGPKTDEVIGDWKREHNKNLHDLFFTPNVI
jgi:hypothetical protein